MIGENNHDEKLTRIILEAFTRMAQTAGAVSAAHRESIATRVIIAARDEVTTVEDLIERAENL